jgi:hypothetical protein
MTHCHHGHHGAGPGRRDWDDIARTTEEFARRVAGEAGEFGERVATHAGEFARRLSREWRHARRQGANWGEDDVRALLKGVRAIVTDVIDGVDDLIDRVFNGDEREARTPTDGWVRVVTNREASCGACGGRIGPGEECHLRRRADGRDFRCAACGVPASGEPSPA